MPDWDQITSNLARTGRFRGNGRRDEDAYYEFFTPTNRPVAAARRGWEVTRSFGKWMRTTAAAVRPRHAAN